MLLKRAEFKRIYTYILCGILLTGICAFKKMNDVSYLAQQTQQKINELYHSGAEQQKLKKHEIQLTEDGFLRFRKFHVSGKQEYYSFNMLRFSGLDYSGSTTGGTIILRTIEDDVIVQTYNDVKGNIDSMAWQISIPVKEIEPADLQLIQDNLLQIRRELQGSN